MEYRVLGPLRAGDGGHLAPARGDRARDVLAVLVERRGHAVSARTLLELVWGSEARELTPSVLHTVVARLRRQFGPAVVDRREDGYLVSGPCDADAFLLAVGAARAADRGSEHVARCREALAMWCGDEPFEGVRDDLVLGERARLRELRRATIVDLATALVADRARASLTEAHELAGRLRADAPLDEEAARLFIRSAYALGRHADAITAFDDIRRSLREELGVGPAPATVALHELVLRHDPHLRSEPVGRRSRVPAPPNATIGRDAELAEIRSALDSGRRLLTLTGPGGSGKSRLLRELGVRLEQEGHEPAYADLSGLTGANERGVAEVVGRAIGLRDDGPETVAALVDSLRGTVGPLLIDEAEWSLEGAAVVVGALLAGCPRLRIVVTSRAVLDVEGEVRMVIGPLAVPGPDVDPADAVDSPAVQLLAHRLADLGAAPDGPIGQWSARDIDAVTSAVRSVDGLPLGIELLAGAADVEGMRGVATPAEQALDVSSGREDRQDSLRTTIDWSLRRLTPIQSQVWRRLAVLADPFEAATARAVTGVPEAPTVIRSLARDNLLHVERRTDGLWLRVLRPLRDRGLEDLVAADEHEAAVERHRVWFVDRWRGAPLSDELVLAVDRTFTDTASALDSSLAVGHSHDAATVALTLARYWQFRESSGPGLAVCERVLALPDLSPADRARLLVAKAGFTRQLTWTDTDRLIRDLDGDADWTASALIVAAIDDYVGDHSEAALATSRRLVAHATAQAPDRAAEAWAVRAAMAASTGQHADEARRAAAEATRLQGASPSAVDLAVVSPKIALALLELGDPAQARRVLERSAAALEARLGLRPTSTMLINLGWAALGTDDPHAALDAFVRGLGASDVWGGGVVGEGIIGSACALAHLGEREAARLLVDGQALLQAEGEALAPTFVGHVERARALSPWTGPSTVAASAADLVERVLEIAARRATD